MPRQRLAGRTSLEQRIHLKLVPPLQTNLAPSLREQDGTIASKIPQSVEAIASEFTGNPKAEFTILSFRRIEWCTPNLPICVRSQQPFGGPKHPNLRNRVAGQHKCHWSKQFQATPLLPNASTPPLSAPIPAKRKAQSGGSGRAISPRTGPDPRRPCPFYSPGP